MLETQLILMTSNNETANKKLHYFGPRMLNSQIKDTLWLKSWPSRLILHLRIIEFADTKSEDNEARLYFYMHVIVRLVMFKDEKWIAD